MPFSFEPTHAMAGAMPSGLGSKESELLGILARGPGVRIPTWLTG